MQESGLLPPSQPEEAIVPSRRDGQLSARPPVAGGIFDAFPQPAPLALPEPGRRAEASRYVLPFLLVALVGLVLAFSYYSSPHRPRPTRAPTIALSGDARVAEAEKWVSQGDDLFKAGFDAIPNDDEALAESADGYRRAWHLLTNREWNRVNHADNDAVAPVVDNERAKALVDKVRRRLVQVEDELARPWWKPW